MYLVDFIWPFIELKLIFAFSCILFGKKKMVDTVDISVVIPTLNEEANAASIIDAVETQLATTGVSYEIIFIDNGSTDRTISIIKELCKTKPEIKLIINTRNFGQMRSPTYGIYQASGKAVIAMCSDFQDPPDLLPQFISIWRTGVNIVLGIRQTENEGGFFFRTLRKIAYALLYNLGDYKIIPNATGFGLYDRRVVDTLKSWNEPEPYFRGMLVETGYSVATIPFVRPERKGGKSKNNYATLIAFSISGLTSSAKKLLALPLYLAIGCFILSGLGFLATLVAVAFQCYVIASLGVSIGLLVIGLIFLFLGLIGEQVRLIAERSRNVPLVIEDERVNF